MATWWNNMSKAARAAYIKKHPNSKFAKRGTASVSGPSGKTLQKRANDKFKDMSTKELKAKMKTAGPRVFRTIHQILRQRGGK